MLLQQQVSLIPRPSPSSPSLAVQLSRRGPGTFSHVSDITDRTNYANMPWGSCKPQPTMLTCTHWSAIVRVKKWQDTKEILVALHKTVGRTSCASTPSLLSCETYPWCLQKGNRSTHSLLSCQTYPWCLQKYRQVCTAFLVKAPP